MLEQELKLTAPNTDVLTQVMESDLIQKYAIGRLQEPKHYLANYYDTKNKVLKNNQCSLRARREDGRFRAAYKQRGQIINGMSERHEYECDIDGWLKNAGMLPECGLKCLVLNLIDESEKLFTVVTVDMQRRILDLEIGATKVELVTDHGLIKGPNESVELFEIELELKAGEINEINKIGDLLKVDYDLTPSVMTKHQIGLSLN